MQLIAADIGNSSTKVAVDHDSDDDRWCIQSVFRGDEAIHLDFDTNGIDDQPAFWSVSSVNKVREKNLQDWVLKYRPDDVFHPIAEADVSLKTEVDSRTQLGRDRLVAAWMATELNDRSGPVIVVDAGTAVTIDLVCDKLIFQGGHIFPGAEPSFRSLSASTDALPDLSNAKRNGEFNELACGELGKSTDKAILHGVYQSQIFGIIGIVDAISKKQESKSVVYITGGGLNDIYKFLPEEWLQVPDLVLRGAKAIGKKMLNAN